MSREIEITVRSTDTTRFMAWLKDHATFIGEFHQVDEYFTPPDRDFTAAQPINEWFRIRDLEGQGSITYKDWQRDTDGQSLYADELETSVGSTEILREILLALKFRQLCTVDKVRKTYRYHDYEIALDQVKTLGDFIEVELIGETTEDVRLVTARMLAFLREHGVKGLELDQVGYPHLILFGDPKLPAISCWFWVGRS